MAVTRKEPKDIAELGPIGIVKEALKLYAAHSKAYIVIQLGLMLPLAMVAEFFFIMQYLPLPPGAPRFLRAVHSSSDLELNLKGHFEVRMPGWLVSIAGSLVYQAAFSLSLSTTLYTVGQFYAGQRVSFFNAVRAATPRLWMRLALTTVYVWVLDYSMYLVYTVASRQTVASLLLGEYNYYEQWRWVWASPVTVLSLVAGFGLAILRMVSSAVSVLEEDYGWAAMKRGLKLLDGKGNVAILLPVLLFVPNIIENGLNAAILFQLSKRFYADFSPSDLALLLFTEVVFLAWTTFAWELRSLCAGVQYVSFKAYHDESLSDSLYEKRTVLVECYERFGDESKVALLKGALVKGNVV